MRNELISYIEGLLDLTYQYEVWVENNISEKYPDKYPKPFHDELDYSIHFLYDDTYLATNPDSHIG